MLVYFSAVHADYLAVTYKLGLQLREYKQRLVKKHINLCVLNVR